MIAVHRDLRFLIPDVAVALSFKRLIDVIGASVVFFLTLPIWIVVSLLIKITSHGPIFFKQRRVGLNGTTFTCLKFRTMCEGADEKKAALQNINEMDGPIFKIRNDPRITPIGRFLRKYSLDELPQLINVLKGDMSLVGPRPPTPDEVMQYKRWHHMRLNVLPGLTCLWQTRARNMCSFDEGVRMDLEYVENWNLMLDFKVLCDTIPAVLKGTGC